MYGKAQQGGKEQIRVFLQAEQEREVEGKGEGTAQQPRTGAGVGREGEWSGKAAPGD